MRCLRNVELAGDGGGDQRLTMLAQAESICRLRFAVEHVDRAVSDVKLESTTISLCDAVARYGDRETPLSVVASKL